MALDIGLTTFLARFGPENQNNHANFVSYGSCSHLAFFQWSSRFCGGASPLVSIKFWAYCTRSERIAAYPGNRDRKIAPGIGSCFTGHLVTKDNFPASHHPVSTRSLYLSVFNLCYFPGQKQTGDSHRGHRHRPTDHCPGIGWLDTWAGNFLKSGWAPTADSTYFFLPSGRPLFAVRIYSSNSFFGASSFQDWKMASCNLSFRILFNLTST